MLRSQRYYDCDCCGFPTLDYNNSNGYTNDICYLCWWEDDSEYGPNGDYSLKEAQENFKKYTIMYRVPNLESYLSAYGNVIDLKKKIMKLLYLIYTSHSDDIGKKMFWRRFAYYKTELRIEQKQLPVNPKYYTEKTDD